MIFHFMIFLYLLGILWWLVLPIRITFNSHLMPATESPSVTCSGKRKEYTTGFV